MKRTRTIVATLLIVGAAACTDDAPDVSRPDDPTQAAFGWTDFGDSGAAQTGSLQVPLDYDDPDAGTIDLFVTRHLATNPDERIGSLLVNPGGPGVAGSDYALYAPQIYGSELLERFDIVAWDPRGTGLSTPAIDCTDDYDRFYASMDITPDDDAERQYIVDLAEEFASLCVSENEVWNFVGTNNSARDMDAIRAALGEDTISYFGFSYGSELGATWATLFPDTVRAAVLDGAADPNANALEASLQQVVGFEEALTRFLADCSARPDCDFHSDGDAEGAFDALMDTLDENPVPTADGRPPVNRSVASYAVGQAMYTDTLWPALAAALDDARNGDGNGLLALYDDYLGRQFDGTYDNTLEAFQVISCVDEPTRTTVAEEDADAAIFNEAAPRFASGTTGSYFCTFFPLADDPRITITGADAGPILVMGTTGDPSTPLASTEAMADTLEDGRLVVVTANQHTGYGVNECSSGFVERYLIDPVNDAPSDGARCD